MGSVTIRSIDDSIKSAVRLEAARNGRSMEAELRALLKRTYLPQNDHAAWLRSLSPKEAIEHLLRMADGVELVIPEREAEDFEFPDL